MNEPQVRVGILSASSIRFCLPDSYRCGGAEAGGEHTASFRNGKVCWNEKLYDELLFEPVGENQGVFELKDVVIGIGFHWERKEDQRFGGALRIFADGGKLTAVNIVPVEDYLASVISSEMSATASLELLKAHAVISRSWLLANMPAAGDYRRPAAEPQAAVCRENEILRWYERDAHDRFDVCADDHCQRYQGVTRVVTDLVRKAIESTRGEVILHEGKICDARFSKCCGGVLEEFGYCWEDVKHPYLTARRDCPGADSATKTTDAPPPLPDLTRETEAEAWIRSAPEAFCHTSDKRILSQVLNNYDQETTDFYRWKVEYTQDELAGLIKRRSGVDYGGILDLIPVARGVSGRLWKLRIVGVREERVIGKELEIRRTLSPSHLYSSAFVVDKEGVENGLPARFILTGAGWGHGVGLCQIGAAVMGEQGYPYDAILLHYYVGASIEKLY